MVIWGQLIGKFTARVLILLEPSTCVRDSEGNPSEVWRALEKRDALENIKPQMLSLSQRA